MTNKENVLFQLEKESINLDGHVTVGVTAKDISTTLGIKRNIVSRYLNELYREGKAIKVNTRPVYFIHKAIYEENRGGFHLANNFINNQEGMKDSVFSNLVGYNGSLKSVVEQCKAATNYPTNGLPILLVGDSGVGKSYIAKLIFDYAKEQDIIEDSAKFIIFNCAEYANNPELLSAALFGACKGAYTGADGDKKGLIEEADGGYLFLDEIHRLSSEGQEKLFIFLDKGVFRRVGESGRWREAKVRIIFATTEDPEKFFLKTFLRRIPLITKIPSFNDRPIMEKLQLIKSIYRKEAISINKDILLEENVINILINSTWNGNVGKLINAIKITCANAFSDRKNVEETKLKINIANIPKEIIASFNSPLVEKDKTIGISINDRDKNLVNMQHDMIRKINKEFIDNINNYRNKKIGEDEFWKKVKHLESLLIKNIEENKFYYYSESTVEFIRRIVTNNLNGLKEKFGMKAQNNSIEVITDAICSVPIEDEGLDIKETLSYLENKYKKLYKLAEKVVSEIEGAMYIKLNDIAIVYIIANLVLINREFKLNLTNAVIIAHGKSTASSVANVANNLLGMYIYDAIDMPIEVSTEDIVKELREHIKDIDSRRGLILIVDMGSLQEIYLGIKDDFKGDIAIINNLSSLLALEVGSKIITRRHMKEIIEEAVENNVFKYKYIPASSNKKDAIITTCSTGIGTAERIKDLLEQCLRDKDITILAYDYDRLKDGGEKEEIFSEYRVRLIIGLSDPKIESIPYLSLEDMIMGNDNSKILSVLRNIVDKDTVEEMNNILLREFTITNVINHLTILNPEKMFSQVEEAINNLEFNLKTKFPNSLKIGVYIHVSCMMERLVIRQPLLEYKNINEFQQCNRHFIKEAKNAFSAMENFYRVQIPVSEIAYIYDTIARVISI